jgi:hypothetical protein
MRQAEFGSELWAAAAFGADFEMCLGKEVVPLKKGISYHTCDWRSREPQTADEEVSHTPAFK